MTNLSFDVAIQCSNTIRDTTSTLIGPVHYNIHIKTDIFIYLRQYDAIYYPVEWQLKRDLDKLAGITQ